MRRDRDGRFRRAIGEDGLELLLKFTIETAVQINAIKPAELERVVVDTTGMDKAIAYPVDSRFPAACWRSHGIRSPAQPSARASL